MIAYGPERVEELRPSDVAQLPAIIANHRVTWVDVQGLGDESLLRQIGDIFDIHALALEDAVNVPQRPKSEAYEQHYLYITRMTMLRSATEDIDTEQVSIFLGSNLVGAQTERHHDSVPATRRSPLSVLSQIGCACIGLSC